MGGFLRGKYHSGLFCLNIPLNSLLVNYVNVFPLFLGFVHLYKGKQRQKCHSIDIMRELLWTFIILLFWLPHKFYLFFIYVCMCIHISTFFFLMVG